MPPTGGIFSPLDMPQFLLVLMCEIVVFATLNISAFGWLVYPVLLTHEFYKCPLDERLSLL